LSVSLSYKNKDENVHSYAVRGKKYKERSERKREGRERERVKE